MHPTNQYNMGIGYSSYYPGQVISTAGAPAAPVPQGDYFLLLFLVFFLNGVLPTAV